MEEITINIISLPNDPKYPHREERKKSVIAQMESEGCKYRFWDGIVDKPRKAGINKAHRRIVAWAKEMGLGSVTIAEDDMLWYGKGAWKYYLDNMPDEYDIYLSSHYSWKTNPDNTIKSFSGLTLYTVHEKYFDKFLSTPDHIHLDTALSLVGGNFVVCPKFVTFQMSGYSEQRGRNADDSYRHKGKPIYTQNA